MEGKEHAKKKCMQITDSGVVPALLGGLAAGEQPPGLKTLRGAQNRIASTNQHWGEY